MARISSLFSLRHLLMISIALNISLILRNVDKSEHHHNDGFSLEKQESTLMADVVKQRTRLSASAFSSSASVSGAETDRVINLDHGDPTMYELYWQQRGDETMVVIPGWQFMSYFSDITNLCWFLEPELGREIKRLHHVVGNAVTEGRHIVVGTGSSQLIMAALYALSPSDGSDPINVVASAPYYSAYPSMVSYLKSGLYKWGGDASTFDKDGLYIEFVTSPNNPDGSIRHPRLNKTGGMVVHDLAYYWPQYTPITSPSDNDISLFTLTKSIGHAGMRIGWALVKDQEVTKKMTKFIELNTIGVSKDSQIRAAKILEVVSSSVSENGGGSFFEYNYHLMAKRWEQLRAAVKQSRTFTLPELPPAYCNFFNQVLEPHTAFAWLKCEEDIEDCGSLLRDHKILTGSGKNFGASPKFVRVSMIGRDDNFNLLIERLSRIH